MKETPGFFKRVEVRPSANPARLTQVLVVVQHTLDGETSSSWAVVCCWRWRSACCCRPPACPRVDPGPHAHRLVIVATRAPLPCLLAAAWVAGYAVGVVRRRAGRCRGLRQAGGGLRGGAGSGIVDTRGRPLLVVLIFATTLLDSLVSWGVAWFLGVRLGADSPVSG